MATRPKLVLIGGPNGAGKSTLAPALLRDTLKVVEFVNADVISQGLSGFHPEAAAFAAGRIMLGRLRDLARQSTLATRSFGPWIRDLCASGYDFHLVFVWIPSADIAVARVRERVRLGGHDVPQDVIRRRHERGLDNFFGLYRGLATTWRFYDNSGQTMRLIAKGGARRAPRVIDRKLWDSVEKTHGSR